ncbi:MAG TPA: hypothetical protein VJK07_00920 [Candidatus Nanoarchaeia archaeon]|nr:hypothetical protein [Candidatus Nanoarchaeia archaeon]
MDDREVFFEGRRHQINRSRELADALVIGRSLYGVILGLAIAVGSVGFGEFYQSTRAPFSEAYQGLRQLEGERRDLDSKLKKQKSIDIYVSKPEEGIKVLDELKNYPSSIETRISNLDSQIKAILDTPEGQSIEQFRNMVRRYFSYGVCGGAVVALGSAAFLPLSQILNFSRRRRELKDLEKEEQKPRA